jgi:CrcB protein
VRVQYRHVIGATHDPFPGLPTDPDVPSPRVAADVLVAVATGGAVGALARWAMAEALPHDSGNVPWATLLTNVVGCFLIGVLMVVVVERLPHRPLVRPLLGTGLLGGFTTFSTYALDTRTLVASDRPALAAAYLLGSLVLGLLAVVAGLRLTERLVR